MTPAPNALYAANATTIAGLTCADNQVAKWNGAGWTCGVDVDTTTTYTAGTGPTLNISNTFDTNNTVVARKDAAAGNQAFDTSPLFLITVRDFSIIRRMQARPLSQESLEN